MGCVSYTDKYFNNGKVTQKSIKAASIAVQQRLEGVKSKYLKLGWDVAICSSGTAKAIHEVLIAQGHEDGIITKKRLSELLQIILDFKCIDDIKISKLSDERKPVFAAGVIILLSIMKEFNISEMHYSSGALREGILYEMDDRFNRSDIRMRTTESLAVRHAVEAEHAENVKQTAVELFEQAIAFHPVKKKKELIQLLSWTALLHEVGLSIHYQGYHKHSAYLLRYSSMPGFNQEQQQLLSTLARFHRKSLKLLELPQFYLYRESDVLLLIRVLRLAVLLNSQRDQQSQPVNLTIEENSWHLEFESEVKNLDILGADIESENTFLQKKEWDLRSNLEVEVQ
jgi:exopolyphosphatase/guanosine-5'-triphosphate,3'-diphosphate pyrophosphatase